VERDAINQLHRDVVCVALFFGFKDSNDVRMVEGGSSLRLLPKALSRIGLAEVFRRYQLERNGPVQQFVVRSPNCSHPALAERAGDLEMGNSLSDQERKT
jgi:hypothetical protein